jgi:phage shock protein PspC (stress-responsive transcriptional regulator)
MNMTDVFNGIGSFFQWTFKIMHHVGFAANFFFWGLIVILVITWLTMQKRFNKEAKASGKLA